MTSLCRVIRGMSTRRVATAHVRCLSGAAAPQPKPVTPDFNTTVDVHTHKLAKPTRPWEGLQGLEARTRGSLIDSTLKAMEENEDLKISMQQLKQFGQKKLTLEEEKKRRRALDALGVPSFDQFLAQSKPPLHLKRRAAPTILQLNIGLYCNQACVHCHVESSPKRTSEQAPKEVIDAVLRVLRTDSHVQTLDITGGAPEYHSEFRRLVVEARKLGKEVIDRCNLTVTQEPGMEDLIPFLAQHKVRVVASLPCYGPKNVNTQRGSGVFDKSIAALLRLNGVGYGRAGTGLSLDLVYNPLGAFLPPEQKKLEAKYKEEMRDGFGIEFNSLFTLTNMPIKRFADFLYRRGELQKYMELLVRNFNPAAVDNVMCTNTLSVRWDGQLYDCDFNNQLDIPCGGKTASKPLNILDLKSLEDLRSVPIATDSHCFGCTAGMGSSCQGATA